MTFDTLVKVSILLNDPDKVSGHLGDRFRVSSFAREKRNKYIFLFTVNFFAISYERI